MNNRDGSTNRQTGQPMNGEHFMSSFRSALSSLDNAQGGGRPATRAQDPYSPSVMDIMPYSRGGGEYAGFRPEGLLSLAFGMPVAPYTDQSLDGVEYEDESHVEQGRDYMRMGYSRTVYGQRPSRSSVQMMMGRGSVGFRTFRSSRLRSGGGMIGMPEAALLGILGAGILGISRGESCGNPLCPVHGTLEGGGHGHGHRHQGFHGPDDDHYEGPIIEELSDDDDQNVDDKPMLALPAPEDDANKRGGGGKKPTKNKNEACGRIEVVRNETYDDRKSNESFSSETGKIKFETDFESDNNGAKPEVNLRLRRTTEEISGPDNRVINDNKDSDIIDYKIIIPMSASNVSKHGFSLKTSQIEYNQETSDAKDLKDTQRPQSPALMFEEVDEGETPTQPIEMTSEDQHVNSYVDKTTVPAIPNTENAGEVQTVIKEEAIENFESLHFEENYFSNETDGSSIFSEDKNLKRKEQVLNEDNFRDNIAVPLPSGVEPSVQSEQPEIRTNATEIDTEDGQRRKKVKRKYQLDKQETETMNRDDESLPSQLNENVTDVFPSISISVGRGTSPIQCYKSEIENENEMIETERKKQTAKHLEDKPNSEPRESTNNDRSDSLDDKGWLKQRNTDYHNPSVISQESERRDTGFDANAIDTFSQNPKENISSQNKQAVEQKEKRPTPPGKPTFYQMIQTRLPDNVSEEDLNRTLGRNASHEDLEDKFKEFDDLANSFNNPVTNTRPKQIKQKNAKPGTLSKTNIQQDSAKSQAKQTRIDTDKTQSSNLDNRHFKFIENSKGIRKALQQNTQDREPERNVSWCERCQKVHIRCGCCDKVLQTLCGNCFKCHSDLARFANQNETPSGEELTQRHSLSKENSEINVAFNSTTPLSTHKRGAYKDMNSHSKEESTVGDSSYAAQSVFNKDRVPPKKPMRNKNASQGPSPIRSPNFTTKPKQNTPTSAGRQYTSSSGYYNDSYYQRQSSSTDRLSKLGEVMLDEGLVVKDVYPDGNCFFAAIVDQLRVRGEFYYTAKSLRNAAVNYLRAHPNQDDGTPLLEFVFDHDGTTWEDYLTRLRRDGEWADHIIISAISSVLRRRIVIHSIRRSDQSINKTIMEPDCIAKLNDKEPIAKRKTDGEDDLDEPTKDGDANVGTRTEDGIDVEELHEDLLLGHIPEAHYVSLRFVDWEERLFKDLREKKDRPHTVLTEYGKRQAADGESKSDSNEELESPPIFNSTYQEQASSLTTSHINFLLKYIRDGDFLQLGPFWTHGRPRQSKFAYEVSRMWGVGDRNNDMESCLVTHDSARYTRAEPEEDPFLEWLIVFSHDTTVSEKIDESDLKQLRPVTTGCKQGFLKLSPVCPQTWGNKTKQIDGICYLKHMHYATDPRNTARVPVFIGIKAEWPKEALECKQRLMRYRGVIDDDKTTFQPKLLDGVRVVPICSEGLSCHNMECVEWKYTFSVIEYVICQHILTKDARYCFKILHHFLNFLFNDKDIITKEHIKAIFFHTCDELEVGLKHCSFFEIISHFMARLEGFLLLQNIPDFFFRSTNLIENIVPEEAKWHHERICVARDNFLVYLFLFLDQKGLMERFSLPKCFDGLLFNAFSRSSMNQNMCFERLTIVGAREWVFAQEYGKAFRVIFKYEQEAYSDGETESEKEESDSETIGNIRLHKLVLRGLPLQERWLYAFFLEYKQGIQILHHVCDVHDCAKILFYFGDSAIELLASETPTQLKSTEMELPLDICRQEGIACFALQFFKLLRDQIRTQSANDAAIAAIHFFLRQHTNILLDKILQGDDGDATDGRNKKTLYALFQLYNRLYIHFKGNDRVIEFYELMGTFDRLCDFEPTVDRYEWLAKEWAAIGNNDKSEEAWMKAKGCQENKYYYSANAKSTRV